ncbi:MAG TPA: PAS domain-containing protein [Terriglobales bacterium]|nr:PAS domain-containing protein [Terriglobales bacterium]
MLFNPTMLRFGVLLLVAIVAFVLGAYVIRRLRKDLAAEADLSSPLPLAPDGLPAHSYHAVIQQLKQQKHELAAQQQAERRKARVSDTLSATVLANLSCGVLFLNASGLVRQANPAARKLLGFASPVGMRISDLFHAATLRPSGSRGMATDLEQALGPALKGKTVMQGLVLDYRTPDGHSHVLELTVSPVLAEDASLMGTTFVLNDQTELARIREDEQLRREISAEMALGLRSSLTTIAGYAQQLAHSKDSDLAGQLASDIAQEAAQLDRTIGSFLAGARAAATSS